MTAEEFLEAQLRFRDRIHKSNKELIKTIINVKCYTKRYEKHSKI